MRYVLQQGLTTIHNCPRGIDEYYAQHIMRESGASYLYLDTDAKYVRIIYNDAHVLYVSYKYSTIQALYYALTNANTWQDVYSIIRAMSKTNKLATKVVYNSYRILGRQAASIVCYIANAQDWDNVTCYYSPSLRRYRIIDCDSRIIAEGNITLYKMIAGI